MMKKVILLSCIFLFSFKVFASDSESLLKKQRIDRHNEIRKELERESSPFLTESMSMNIPSIPDFTQKYISSKEYTTWELLGELNLIDIVSGLFSISALVMGGIYLLWHMNPFKGKTLK